MTQLNQGMLIEVAGKYRIITHSILLNSRLSIVYSRTFEGVATSFAANEDTPITVWAHNIPHGKKSKATRNQKIQDFITSHPELFI